MLAHGYDLRVAIEEERLSRRKYGLAHWFQNPVGLSVPYCLDACGIALKDVSRIVSSDLLPRKIMSEWPDMEIRTFSHHLCHAASAVCLLPPDAKAAVIVYDGEGSIIGRSMSGTGLNRETFGFFRYEGGELLRLGRTTGSCFDEADSGYPTASDNSIGMLYEVVTAAIGFDLMETGKTMGLAAHGRPRFLAELEALVTFGSGMDDCFSCNLNMPDVRDRIGELLNKEMDRFAARVDMAASAQVLLERVLLHCYRLLPDDRYDAVCLVGGCALNPVANSVLARHLRDGVRLVVPPFAGDAGIGFGALWLDAREQAGRPIAFTMRGAPLDPAVSRPGKTYSATDIAQAVSFAYPSVAVDASVTTPENLAMRLARGEVIGVFQGPSESGPRALGGRSILADPRDALVRERINRSIKHREPFRPLAPMILAEDFPSYFDDPRQMDRFMLRVATATERCRREAPAIVHVDGTARVQIIDERSDPFLLDILRAFRQQTGVPLLLNTSFNRRGEPLVETPTDAIDAFRGMGLDGLFLQGTYCRPISA
ncbi:hypothetical protein Sp245p_03800 [Azospirillum baldaniorum]|nr:hypothetical protein Sp245p_03800 [Azospirillum baldaniorum]